MAAISIDLGISDTLRAINEILARRESGRATAWEPLDAQLQVVLRTVEELDTMYLKLLAEIGDIFAQPQPSIERITGAIQQATTYCTNETLALSLMEARGQIKAAAFNDVLKPRRYRDLAQTLRSVDEPLARYIDRLSQLQDADDPEIPTHDQHWDLRTVLQLLKLVAAHLSEHGGVGQEIPDASDACEEAVRNYNRSLSLAIATLIGHARQDLAMDRL
jgi:hypothetical protein